MNRRPRVRTLGRIGATAATAACIAGLVVSGAGLWVGGLPADAAVIAGSATVVTPDGAALTAGNSNTPFRFKLPADDPGTTAVNEAAACTGDSANGGYRIQSYIVPRNVGLDTLKFDDNGPVPVAGQFRSTMYGATSSQDSYTNQLTAQAIPAPGPGFVVQPLPSFDFAVYSPGGFPLTPGDYNVGIACTLGPPSSATQLDKYWNAAMKLTADATEPGPAKVRWTVTAADTTTTTTTSTTSVSGSSTTSTTATSGSSTTSSTVAGSGSTGGSGDGTNAVAATASGAKDLPKTGGSFVPLVIWAFLLLCFGRAAVLLGRRPSPPSDGP